VLHEQPWLSVCRRTVGMDQLDLFLFFSTAQGLTSSFTILMLGSANSKVPLASMFV
jgi:hypothetical protein